MNQQALTSAFLSFCPMKNKRKVKSIIFEGEIFFAFSMGQIGAMGVNFDPYIASDSDQFKPCDKPRLLIWETMPETETRNLRLERILEIAVGQPIPGRPNMMFVKTAKSVFAEMNQFTRVIDATEEFAGRKLVRV